MVPLVWVTLLGCQDKAPTDSSVDTGELQPQCESPGPQDDTLRLDATQSLGTHNSYHIEPETPLDDSWVYTMQPLSTQLTEAGVRQVELDVHYEVDLGWQVFHLPGVDDGTVCLQLADCLSELKAWSDERPCHLPLTVWIEPKDDIDAATDNYLPLSGRWDDLDATLLEVWPASRLYTPDDLRGDAATLPDALAADGWPTLGALRGQIVPAFLDTGAYRDEYLTDRPAAEGRLMFPRSDDPTAASAAIFKLDDPVSEYDAIQARVGEGFLVTCTSDEVGEAIEVNAARLDLALSAGCHSVSTNAPSPYEIDGFTASIPEGTPARCNPVSAPEGCTSEAVEDLP